MGGELSCCLDRVMWILLAVYTVERGTCSNLLTERGENRLSCVAAYCVFTAEKRKSDVSRNTREGGIFLLFRRKTTCASIYPEVPLSFAHEKAVAVDGSEQNQSWDEIAFSKFCRCSIADSM